ncbi:hypothetical protein WDW86_14365 [Bdellovibrionota bacterium FG-2]
MNSSGRLSLGALLATLVISGCATTRSKTTDPAHRIFLDSESLNETSYVNLQATLTKSGKWIVVDRKRGIAAIKNEQDLILSREPERFDNREKYALLGKLHSVGAVVVGHETCNRFYNWLGHMALNCQQYATVIDANTGEVLAAAQSTKKTGEDMLPPSWDDTVESLNDSFPTEWAENISSKLEQYRAIAEENAQKDKRNAK